MNYCIYTDEVGYGAWAGPVVVCSVLSQICQNSPVQDSKMLNSTARKQKYTKLCISTTYAITWSHAHEIDRLGLRKATDKAIINSWDLLYQQNKNHNIFCKSLDLFNNHHKVKVVLDGRYIPQHFQYDVSNLISGDRNNQCIANASILAKETRDKYMKMLSKIYPEYLWDQNVGYGTRQHINAIQSHGITNFHRKSYKPLQKYNS